MRRVAQSVWPQCRADGLRPALSRVEELLSRALREIADRALRNSILEVGVDPTEGKLLSFLFARLLEGVVREPAIVASNA